MPIGTTAAIIGGAAIGAGGSFLSAKKAAKASKKAARAQVLANQAAIAEQRRQFDLTRQDFAPFRETGVKANNLLEQILIGGDPSAIINDAVFRVAADEAQQRIDSQFASAGLLQSGARIKALRDATAASANDVVQRLLALSGRGQAATSQVGAFGAQKASNIAALLQSQGAARASGFIGSANAFNQGLGGILQSVGSVLPLLTAQQSPSLFPQITAPTVPTTPDFSFAGGPFGG